MVANKSWADITILGGGVPFLEIQEITYNRERKKEDHYGAGDKVVSRGYGNVMDTNLTLKMSQDELNRIAKTAPNGDITLIPPFVIKVVVKGAGGWTDTLTNVEFSENGAEWKQGDTKGFKTIKGIFAGFNDPQ